MNIAQPYGLTLWAMAFSGFLLLLQLMIADIVAIKAGQKPGHPIPADSTKFLFRSARAHANMNESLSAYVLFAVVGVLGGANPLWLNALAWAYALCRAAYMLAYYAGVNLLRSILFALSFVVLVALLVAALSGLLN